MKESNLKNKIMKDIKFHSDIFLVPTTDLVQRGIPDLVGGCRGVGLFLELKRKGGKPTKIQRKRGAELILAGQVWVYLDCFRDWLNLKTKLLETLPPVSCPHPLSQHSECDYYLNLLGSFDQSTQVY